MKQLKNTKLFEKKTDKAFFITINNILFKSFIGFFLGAFILFLVLAFLYNVHEYVNLAFYTAIGLVVYFVGYFISYFLHKKNLNLPNVEQDKKNKNILLTSFFVSTLFYFMISWLLMIFIGSFNGFGLYFASNPNVLAFTNNLYNTKVMGFILFYITLFLTFVLFVIYLTFLKFKKKANITFNIRRKMVEKVRSEAQKNL